MPLEMWELPDDVLHGLSKYHEAVKQAKQKIELEKEVCSNRPPTYVQSRATKSLEYNQKKLDGLDEEYRLKKLEYETAIAKAKRDMEYKSASLVRAETTLQRAIKERDQAIHLALNSCEPEKKLTVKPPVVLPEYKRPPKPINIPQEEKIYYDPEGNPCSEWEYNFRQRKYGGEKTHNPLCVSSEVIPKPKKLLKIAEKR